MRMADVNKKNLIYSFLWIRFFLRTPWIKGHRTEDKQNEHIYNDFVSA